MSTINTVKPAGGAAIVRPAAFAGTGNYNVAAAAAALAPALRERADEADASAKLPDATIADLEKARLFDMARPKMYGGLQVSFDTYLDAMIEVSRGDASTGWTLGLISTGIWLAAIGYSQKVTDEVFGQDPNVRFATAINPRKAKTRRVAGGYVIEDGLWMYNTGIYHSQWDQVGIPLVDDAGQVVGRGVALVPASAVTLLDDWDTIGLRGTGSTSVTIKDVFVPDERIISMSRIAQDDYAASHLRDVPLYRLPMVPTLAVRLAGSMVGMGRAAVDLFMQKIGTRGIAFTTYDKQDDAPVTHLQIGEATGKIDAAEAILRHAIRLLETGAERREQMSLEQRARIWRDAGMASRMIWEAVDQLASASGTAFVNRGAPMNRVWHDVKVASVHGAIYSDTFYELYGRIAAGKTSNSPQLPALT
ncbi:acyl-CoA dehydrogenase family protein [Paraburkholderia solisilvae]|uniref:Flavin-dependent monooxygenase, oxygenase subunit HsaA n=1 Tax=Paraburkholderia solisilvae TaxID=624376 RepID=A0A6J5E3Y8_9BURK|nr:acyl-CoA dehydrogenase family protein [Paraburkholderia solisilvae]CAB3759792.1 Flavin-dependent monooxygenase, oxygenase subunit HsaA [Paraburkholderia solisilvae]